MAQIANLEFSNTVNQRFDFTDNVIRMYGNVRLPMGATSDRPPTEDGLIRYNQTSNRYEGVENNVWVDLRGSSAASIPVGNTLANGMFQTRANRSKINFINGTNITIEVDDDSSGDRANVTISAIAGGDVAPAFAHANSAHIHANQAFDKANVAAGWATQLFDSTDVIFAHANAAHATSNAAFARANAGIQHSNLAFDAANAAFAVANAGGGVGPVFAHANAAHSSANAALQHSNLSFAAANAAFIHANSGHTHANQAFAMANGANNLSVGEILTSNDAFFVRSTRKRLALKAGDNMTITIVDDAADDKINVTFTATSGGPGADPSFAYGHANMAYAHANSGHTHANLAFAAANASFAHANSGHAHANQAFVKANAALANVSGTLFSGMLNVESALMLNQLNVKPHLVAIFAHANTAHAHANAAFAVANSAAPVSAATQAELEAASSTTVFTSPGRQHFHPSAAKFWTFWGVTSTISASYNTTSITDSGSGDWTVNIATDFSSANWSADYTVGTTHNNTRVPFVTGKAAGTIRCECLDGGFDWGGLADPTNNSVIGFGDHT